MVVAKASNRIAIKAKERTSTEINRKRNGGVVVSLRIVVKGMRPARGSNSMDVGGCKVCGID